MLLARDLARSIRQSILLGKPPTLLEQCISFLYYRKLGFAHFILMAFDGMTWSLVV